MPLDNVRPIDESLYSMPIHAPSSRSSIVSGRRWNGADVRRALAHPDCHARKKEISVHAIGRRQGDGHSIDADGAV